jgi:hypothetical protein
VYYVKTLNDSMCTLCTNLPRKYNNESFHNICIKEFQIEVKRVKDRFLGWWFANYIFQVFKEDCIVQYDEFIDDNVEYLCENNTNI